MAQDQQMGGGEAPIAQQLVREGTFAVRLQSALALGTTEDEIEAENRLAEFGILPRNGWIADYPVTPDVLGEIQRSVLDAAVAGRLSISEDDAAKRVNDTAAGFGLSIKPYAAAKNTSTPSSGGITYPNQTVINNYYSAEGPPVVTYYSPPPDYYYLYAWVPFPFWFGSIWFPGYFVLHDFHRTVVVRDRVVFVSNHFNDVRAHRVFRVDPVTRFNGRTYAGIGVKNRRGFITTGVPRSEHVIFNAPRTRVVPGGRVITPRGGTRVISPTGRIGGRVRDGEERGIAPVERSGERSHGGMRH
jgi:hypothetical protein